MAGTARYLWGKTKIDILRFKKIDPAPTIKVGTMFVDSTGLLRYSQDGTKVMTVMLSSSSCSSSSRSSSSRSSSSSSLSSSCSSSSSSSLSSSSSSSST